MKKYIMVTGFSFLLLLSISLKWQRYQNDPTNSETSQGRTEKTLQIYMERSGFVLVDTMDLSKGGMYKAYKFAKTGCSKVYNIADLGENDEGLSLFINKIKSESYGIIYSGNIYENIPIVNIQIQRVKNTIFSMFQKRNNSFLRVIAISPKPVDVLGKCDLDVSFFRDN